MKSTGKGEIKGLVLVTEQESRNFPQEERGKETAGRQREVPLCFQFPVSTAPGWSEELGGLQRWIRGGGGRGGRGQLGQRKDENILFQEKKKSKSPSC